MRYAILINSVTSARQLKKLTERLSGSLFDIYIHISKKLDLSPYTDILAQDHVFTVNDRIATYTGGYSKVKATLAGLRQISDSDTAYANITLLSCREYPIKSNDDIITFFKAHEGEQLISYNINWKDKNPEHFYKHHFPDSNIPGKELIAELMDRFWGRPQLPKRLKIVGGSSRWTITPDCAKYVLSYIERCKFERTLRYVKNTEKFLIQSVIMHSSFKNAVVNNNYHYSEGPGQGKHSKLLRIGDLINVMASDGLFAGRFDIHQDEKIFGMIDETIQRRVAGLN